jgi:hypothetical protein
MHCLNLWPRSKIVSCRGASDPERILSMASASSWSPMTPLIQFFSSWKSIWKLWRPLRSLYTSSKRNSRSTISPGPGSNKAPSIRSFQRTSLVILAANSPDGGFIATLPSERRERVRLVLENVVSCYLGSLPAAASSSATFLSLRSSRVFLVGLPVSVSQPSCW